MTLSVTPPDDMTVQEALEQAQQAMERAGAELNEGKSASAAGSQREAIEALQRAAKSAEEGVTPTSEEGRRRAQELAETSGSDRLQSEVALLQADLLPHDFLDGSSILDQQPHHVAHFRPG